VALSTAFPQLGGLWSLLTELDFGSLAGLKSLYFKTRAALPALSGVLRLASLDSIGWRNAANSADVLLSKDTADALSFSGNYITGNPMLGANSVAGQSIPVFGGNEVVVVFGTVERDSDAAYNSGTGRYTIPAGKGGDYEIGASIAYAAAPGGVCTCSIYKNTVLLKQSAFIAPGAGQTISVSAPVATLAPGDVIDIRTKHGNVGAQALTAIAALNYFALKRITT